MAKWLSDMSLSYEARVAVRGELASPKSFPRLILNNMDDRDKRETHQKLARIGTKKHYSHQSASLLQTVSIGVTFEEKIPPFTFFFFANLVMPSICEIKRSLIDSCINPNEQQQLHAKYIQSFKCICNLQWKAEEAYGVNPAFIFWGFLDGGSCVG